MYTPKRFSSYSSGGGLPYRSSSLSRFDSLSKLDSMSSTNYSLGSSSRYSGGSYGSLHRPSSTSRLDYASSSSPTSRYSASSYTSPRKYESTTTPRVSSYSSGRTTAADLPPRFASSSDLRHSGGYSGNSYSSSTLNVSRPNRMYSSDITGSSSNIATNASSRYKSPTSIQPRNTYSSSSNLGNTYSGGTSSYSTTQPSSNRWSTGSAIGSQDRVGSRLQRRAESMESTYSPTPKLFSNLNEARSSIFSKSTYTPRFYKPTSTPSYVPRSTYTTTTTSNPYRGVLRGERKPSTETESSSKPTTPSDTYSSLLSPSTPTKTTSDDFDSFFEQYVTRNPVNDRKPPAQSTLPTSSQLSVPLAAFCRHQFRKDAEHCFKSHAVPKIEIKCSATMHFQVKSRFVARALTPLAPPCSAALQGILAEVVNRSASAKVKLITKKRIPEALKVMEAEETAKVEEKIPAEVFTMKLNPKSTQQITKMTPPEKVGPDEIQSLTGKDTSKSTEIMSAKPIEQVPVPAPRKTLPGLAKSTKPELVVEKAAAVAETMTGVANNTPVMSNDVKPASNDSKPSQKPAMLDLRKATGDASSTNISLNLQSPKVDPQVTTNTPLSKPTTLDLRQATGQSTTMCSTNGVTILPVDTKKQDNSLSQPNTATKVVGTIKIQRPLSGGGKIQIDNSIDPADSKASLVMKLEEKSTSVEEAVQNVVSPQANTIDKKLGVVKKLDLPKPQPYLKVASPVLPQPNVEGSEQNPKDLKAGLRPVRKQASSEESSPESNQPNVLVLNQTVKAEKGIPFDIKLKPVQLKAVDVEDAPAVKIKLTFTEMLQQKAAAVNKPEPKELEPETLLENVLQRSEICNSNLSLADSTLMESLSDEEQDVASISSYESDYNNDEIFNSLLCPTLDNKDIFFDAINNMSADFKPPINIMDQLQSVLTDDDFYSDSDYEGDSDMESFAAPKESKRYNYKMPTQDKVLNLNVPGITIHTEDDEDKFLSPMTSPNSQFYNPPLAYKQSEVLTDEFSEEDVDELSDFDDLENAEFASVDVTHGKVFQAPTAYSALPNESSHDFVIEDSKWHQTTPKTCEPQVHTAVPNVVPTFVESTTEMFPEQVDHTDDAFHDAYDQDTARTLNESRKLNHGQAIRSTEHPIFGIANQELFAQEEMTHDMLDEITFEEARLKDIELEHAVSTKQMTEALVQPNTEHIPVEGVVEFEDLNPYDSCTVSEMTLGNCELSLVPCKVQQSHEPVTFDRAETFRREKEKEGFALKSVVRSHKERANVNSVKVLQAKVPEPEPMAPKKTIDKPQPPAVKDPDEKKNEPPQLSFDEQISQMRKQMKGNNSYLQEMKEMDDKLKNLKFSVQAEIKSSTTKEALDNAMKLRNEVASVYSDWKATNEEKFNLEDKHLQKPIEEDLNYQKRKLLQEEQKLIERKAEEEEKKARAAKLEQQKLAAKARPARTPGKLTSKFINLDKQEGSQAARPLEMGAGFASARPKLPGAAAEQKKTSVPTKAKDKPEIVDANAQKRKDAPKSIAELPLNKVIPAKTTDKPASPSVKKGTKDAEPNKASRKPTHLKITIEPNDVARGVPDGSSDVDDELEKVTKENPEQLVSSKRNKELQIKHERPEELGQDDSNFVDGMEAKSEKLESHVGKIISAAKRAFKRKQKVHPNRYISVTKNVDEMLYGKTAFKNFAEADRLFNNEKSRDSHNAKNSNQLTRSAMMRQHKVFVSNSQQDVDSLYNPKDLTSMLGLFSPTSKQSFDFNTTEDRITGLTAMKAKFGSKGKFTTRFKPLGKLFQTKKRVSYTVST